MFSPDYYNKFKCIADKCEDSCCRSGWEIPIDDDTYAAYKAHGISDLDDNITTGADGDRIFKLRSDGVCPYLRSNGLCRLYTETGGRLGEICANYPRFFEEYDGFTEAGISISCPEAQRIILSAVREDYELPGEKPAEELLEFLHKAREHAYDIAFSSETMAQAAISLLDFASRLQELIDDGRIDSVDEAIESELSATDDCEEELKGYIEQFCEIALENTDILYLDWRKTLQKGLAGDIKEEPFYSEEIKALLAYYIYRFFLKAVNTEDVFAVTMLIVMAILSVSRLTGDFYKNARLFSKEIEHNADNFDSILDEIF